MKKWYEKNFRRLMTAWSSGYSEDPKANADSVLPTLDTDKWALFLKDCRIEVFSTHVRSHSGYLLFPGKSGPPDPKLSGRDFFGEILNSCHSRDIKVVGMMQICPDSYAGVQHPEWRQINNQGQPSVTGKNPWYMCFNNPDREAYLMAQVSEVVKRYPGMDGLMFDEYGFKMFEPDWYCYCPCCLRLFREKSGQEPPRDADFDNPLWINFINWRIECTTNFFQRLRAHIKALNPHLPVTMIFYATNWWPSWRSGQSGPGLAPFLDYISQDFSPSSVLRESEMFKYYQVLKPGVVNEHIVDFYMNMGIPRQGVLDVTHGTPPQLAIASGVTGLSMGGAAGIDFATGPGGIPSGPTSDCIKDVMNHVAQVDEYLGGAEPFPYAGLISSEKTANYYGRKSQSLWVSSYLGAYKALVDTHIPFSIIPIEMKDPCIPDDVKVLMLPNIVSLSDAEAEQIRQFVHNGGGLVATYATGLCDERGKKRKNFALADVFGTDYVGGMEADQDLLEVEDPRGWRGLKQYSVTVGEHPVVEKLGAFDFNLVVSAALKVKMRGAQAPAFYSAAGISYAQYPSKEHVSENPSVVVNNYGKGRVVYLSAKLDAQYAVNAHPWTRRLMKQAVLWAANHPLSVELIGPMSVEMNLLRRKEHSQLVLHLVNFQSASNRNMLPFIGAETVCGYLVEEILPVYNLKLRICPDIARKIKDVFFVPGPVPLKQQHSADGCLEATIPHLHIHGMVMMQLK